MLLAMSILGIAGARVRNGSAAIYFASAIISVAAFINGATFLLSAPPPSIAVLPLGLPWIGAHFRIDALSAFFLALVNFGGSISSIYAIGYGRHETSPGRVLPFYPAFLAAMNFVLLADDAFTFLFCWELMSLTSWALVMAHDKEAGNARAGFIYLVMASFGTASLLLAFGLLAGPSGDYLFTSMRELHRGDLVSGIVLILALIGTGSKAGLVPLHAWLPLAHPAAPSHVSALMSGVMTKVAIYGFIRIVMDLLGTPQWWWAIVILVVGAITSVLGVLQALMEKDIKRLLACSTIENVGIVFVGLGLSLAFASNGYKAGAALGLTAALLHALNHSFFKSLLFFGTGAVLGATHERNIEHMGGLIHRMPKTAVLMLVGSAAISALPPLNGFASEWLVFQTVLISPQLPQWGLKFFVPAVGAMLALAAALAAACFVRLYGIAFLGRPRSEAARAANETDQWSLGAMAMLAVLCLLAGILPGILIDGLAPVTELLTSARMPIQTADLWQSIVPISESRSSYNGLLVFVFVALSAGAGAFAIHRLATSALRRGPAWDCGYPDPSPLTQYTGASFAEPIRRVYGTTVFRATEHVDMPTPGDTRAAVYEPRAHDVIWEVIYDPIGRGVETSSKFLNKVQFLSIRHYLTLVFIALIILLLGLAIWP